MHRLVIIALAACGSDPLRYGEPLDTATKIVTVGAVRCEVAQEILPVEDTFLFEQAPAQAQASRPDVFYSAQIGSRCYPLVRFDASSIPEGDLLAARFLFTTVNGGWQLDASLVGGGFRWGDGTTWDDMQANDTPLLDLPRAVATVTAEGRSALEIPTSWVDEWRSGAHVNNGFMLQASNTVGFGAFSSSEGDDPPVMQIAYMKCTEQAAL